MTLRDRLNGFLGLVPPALPAESPTAPAPQRIDHDDFAAVDEAPPDILLIAHIAGRGDTPADQQGWCGVSDVPKHIEGFTATHGISGWARDVRYQAIVAGGALGEPISAGSYCGTRGKNQPLHGFVVHAADGRRDLSGLAYEGVFRDGFRSGRRAPGQSCVAPSGAPLVAMHLTLAAQPAVAAENVRLVIWDLDETFWGGTLTEGGIAWRTKHADIVRSLAERGIISSICSKNDPADVFAVLAKHNMKDHFVLPSISWEAKGPRLAALIGQVQLRPPTVLFIDDNALNRAEAKDFVPGLQVMDETCIGTLLQHPLLQGKPDPGLTRLAQYRLLERRNVDQARSAGDTSVFLRESGITVRLEHDIAPHIDRAVELVNRTNQLNFTKARLPDDPENPDAAREALLALLSQHTVQAALVHVRDRYGDYGYCGFYVMKRLSTGTPELLHFAFSCRILGMGVETWLYRTLNRPLLRQAGKVASDPAGETLAIDWINAKNGKGAFRQEQRGKKLSYVLLRGACELRPLAHYFEMATDQVIEEFDTWRMGQMPLANHSVIASQAMDGIDGRAVADAELLGFIEEDFRTFLAGQIPAGPAVWVFGFAIERLAPMFEHKETGILLPWTPVGLTEAPDVMMSGGPFAEADPAVVDHLRAKFRYVGRRPNERLDTLFRNSLQAIFSKASTDISIFVIHANTRMINGNGKERVLQPIATFNALVADIAKDYPYVELLAPLDFMTPEEIGAMKQPNHFDRITYYRMFRHICERVGMRKT
jgi:FkbH-like protein